MAVSNYIEICIYIYWHIQCNGKRPYAAFNNCAYAPLHFKEAAFQVEDNFTKWHRTLDSNNNDNTTQQNWLDNVFIYYILHIATLPLLSCPLPFVHILTATGWGKRHYEWRR